MLHKLFLAKVHLSLHAPDFVLALVSVVGIGLRSEKFTCLELTDRWALTVGVLQVGCCLGLCDCIDSDKEMSLASDCLVVWKSWILGGTVLQILRSRRRISPRNFGICDFWKVRNIFISQIKANTYIWILLKTNSIPESSLASFCSQYTQQPKMICMWISCICAFYHGGSETHLQGEHTAIITICLPWHVLHETVKTLH